MVEIEGGRLVKGREKSWGRCKVVIKVGISAKSIEKEELLRVREEMEEEDERDEREERIS